jgi:hypothetical protein
MVGRERVELSSDDYESPASTDMLTAQQYHYNTKVCNCQEIAVDYCID